MHLARAASLSGVETLIDSLNLDKQVLLAEAGISATSFAPENADQYIPLGNIEQLYSLAENACGQYDLAARAGSQQQLSTLLGVLGFVMQQSSTVGAALINLQHYFSFQLKGAFLQLQVDGDFIVESLVVKEAYRLPSLRHTAEFAMAAGVSIMRTLCGEDWRPVYVEFMHKNPDKRRQLKKYYFADIRFEQERNAIVFAKSDLNSPITSNNPQLNKLLQVNLDLLETQYRNDLASQVEQLIYQALSAGNCSVDKVAAFMGVHRRSLHRLLKQADTSYSEILDKVRKNTALNILKQTDMPLTDLTSLLCYSEPSAFSRAFKGWYGVSPRQWRARHAVDSIKASV